LPFNLYVESSVFLHLLGEIKEDKGESKLREGKEDEQKFSEGNNEVATRFGRGQMAWSSERL